MKRFILCSFGRAAFATSLLAAVSIPSLAQSITDQAKRGQTLFQKGAHGVACVSCHSLDGQGVSIGPDLRNIARVHPRGVVMAILASRTQYVVEVTTKDGKSFPGMRAGNDVYWDLAATPPAKRTVSAADLKSVIDNGKWRHPPESTGFSREELADLIAYVRFVAIGDTKGVKPEDLPSR